MKGRQRNQVLQNRKIRKKISKWERNRNGESYKAGNKKIRKPEMVFTETNVTENNSLRKKRIKN